MISAREVSAAENKVATTLKVLQHNNIKSITALKVLLVATTLKVLLVKVKMWGY